MRITRILFPTDFSESSEEALVAAAQLAERFDASVTVMHVIQLPFGAGPPEVDLVEHVRKGAYAGLAATADRLRRRGASVVQLRCNTGIPYHEICLVAREEHFDLIVMGTHGRTGISRAILGSVAEKVFRHAPCPVLTVRPLERSPEEPAVELVEKAVLQS